MHDEPTLSDLTAEADGAGCKTRPADGLSDFDSSSEPRRRRDEDLLLYFFLPEILIASASNCFPPFTVHAPIR
jgi:hypothetical protein